MSSITLAVKSASGGEASVSIAPTATIAELKASLGEQTGAEGFRLIFGGKILKDEQTVSDCGLEDGHAIHSVGGKARAAAAAAAPASSAAGAAAPEAAAAAAAAAAAPPAPAPSPSPAAAAATTAAPAANIQLEEALYRMQLVDDAAKRRTCLSTLVKIVSNVVEHPHEEKYRRVKVGYYYY